MPGITIGKKGWDKVLEERVGFERRSTSPRMGEEPKYLDSFFLKMVDAGIVGEYGIFMEDEHAIP